MDQTTYFLFRCSACRGRSRVASAHAGQTIVCPHCQASSLAQPDTPLSAPAAGDTQSPATTKRFAQPFGTSATASLPRPQSASSSGTQELFPDERVKPGQTREIAPGMSGFSDPQPPTTGIRRPSPGTATVSRIPAPATGSHQRTTPAARTAPAGPSKDLRPSHVPFFVASAAAAIFALLAILAMVDASTYRTRFQQARNEADKGATQSADLQATAETLDKRLARTQAELAAAQAAVAREREIVAELHKTVTRLGEDLAKASRVELPGLTTTPAAGAVGTIAAGGTFPSATLPIAGVPMNRREPAPTAPALLGTK